MEPCFCLDKTFLSIVIEDNPRCVEAHIRREFYRICAAVPVNQFNGKLDKYF